MRIGAKTVSRKNVRWSWRKYFQRKYKKEKNYQGAEVPNSKLVSCSYDRALHGGWGKRGERKQKIRRANVFFGPR